MGKHRHRERRADLLKLIAGNPKPMSLRYLYYQMGDLGWPQSGQEGKNFYTALGKDLVAMRNSGQVPVQWIVDLTRNKVGSTSQYSISADASLEVAIATAQPYSSIWGEHGLRPHLWVESEGTAGMLTDLADELEISIWPCRGQPSVSFCYEGAQDHPTHVGTMTDFDWAGRGILAEIKNKLRRWGATRAIVQEVAITAEQMSQWAGREVDGRMAVEAIPFDDLCGLVRGWVDSLLPDGAWEEYENKCENKKQRMRELKAGIREMMRKEPDDE